MKQAFVTLRIICSQIEKDASDHVIYEGCKCLITLGNQNIFTFIE